MQNLLEDHIIPPSLLNKETTPPRKISELSSRTFAALVTRSNKFAQSPIPSAPVRIAGICCDCPLTHTITLLEDPVLFPRTQRHNKSMAHHLLSHSLPLREVSAVDTANITSSASEGWVSSPNRRGTIDILWGCLLTTFLCTWTSLHLNLPALSEHNLQRWLRRLRWMVQAFLAPEFILGLATGQKVEARRSISLWKDSGYDEWTIYHGFYATMGGFILQPRDSKPFPVDYKQLHYLVTRGYVRFPDITETKIRKMGKQDTFEKLLTLLQLGWFIVQCIGRAIQHLPITTLELATSGLVVCTVASYCQWFHKPLDAEEATIVTSQKSTREILIEAGKVANKPYTNTPLDFIDDSGPSWHAKIQPFLRSQAGLKERPLPRVPNDTLPVIGANLDAIFLLTIIMTYSCLHFIAWNFHFPTHGEQRVWRINCITMVTTAFIFFSCHFYQSLRGLCHHEIGWQAIVTSAAVVIYTAARMYIAVESFVGLRSLPTGAFNSVQWSNFIPHF